MSGDPKLGAMTKVQLAAFASELAVKYPDQRRAIFGLQDTLDSKLSKNPELQNDIIRKLNANTSGTLDNARKVIEKDPKILEQVNQDPTKLATLMGIKMPPPATVRQAAPVAVAAAAGPAKAEPAKAESAKAEPAKAEPAKVAAVKAEPAKADAAVKTDAAPAAATVATAKPAPAAVVANAALSDQEVALRSEIAKESLKVTKMEGFNEFSARAGQSQSLEQAIDAMMGKNEKSPQAALKSLQELQQDPKFFVKANAAIDEIPEQAREATFTEIAQNPDLGKRAIAGDANAKSELQSKVMMGGLFGGGPEGKGGLAGLMNGDMMKGLGEMLQKIIPAIMQAFKGMLGKLMGGLEKLGDSQGLMRMGNNPEGTGALTQKLGQALGVDAGKIPVVDASKPGDPAVPAAQLANKAPQAPQVATPAPREPERPAMAAPGAPA